LGFTELEKDSYIDYSTAITSASVEMWAAGYTPAEFEHEGVGKTWIDVA
jgi:hypothetical protein